MSSLTRWAVAVMLCAIFLTSAMSQDNSAGSDPRANVDRKRSEVVMLPLGINSNSRAIAMDLRNSREVKIGLSNASVTPFGIATGGRPFYGGDFDGNGTWYVVATPDTLYSVDTTTGVFTQLGRITGIPAASNTSGLTWDYSTNTMYLCNLVGGVATLYTFNIGTLTATAVGPILTGTIIDIACSNTGQIYGVKFAAAAGVSDSLVSINKTTGAGITVGPLGVDVNFAHGLDFDPATDSLFYPGYIGAGVNNLYRINTTTGLATLVGPLAAGEYDCFSVMGRPANPGSTYNVPEILYYKFEDNPSTSSATNYAIPGQGTNPALLMNMGMGPGGQFDSALVGNAGTGTSTYLATGWNMNFGQSSWTISVWINNFPSVTGTSYIFGNDITTSFRCFTNGAAGAGNITLRGNNFTNVNVTGVLPGPSVVHFVYDSSTTTVRTYVNGVFQSSVVQSALNLTAAVPFKVGSYGTAASIPVGALVDEFRVYSRALDTVEIRNTWNHTLPYNPTTGVTPSVAELPSSYTLEQNYPNPFNPTTTIQYGLPSAANVTLKIYNVLGQEVATLVDGQKNGGTFQILWNGRNAAGSPVATGLYFYSLTARAADGKSTYTNIKKMLLVK